MSIYKMPWNLKQGMSQCWSSWSWKILKVFVQVPQGNLPEKESEAFDYRRIKTTVRNFLAACPAHSTETSGDRFSDSGRLTIVPEQGSVSGLLPAALRFWQFCWMILYVQLRRLRLTGIWISLETWVLSSLELKGTSTILVWVCGIGGVWCWPRRSWKPFKHFQPQYHIASYCILVI